MYFQRLRDLREDNDKKQSEIAEMLGIKLTVCMKYGRNNLKVCFTYRKFGILQKNNLQNIQPL